MKFQVANNFSQFRRRRTRVFKWANWNIRVSSSKDFSTSKASTLVLAVAGAGCVVLVSTHPLTHHSYPFRRRMTGLQTPFLSQYWDVTNIYQTSQSSRVQFVCMFLCLCFSCFPFFVSLFVLPHTCQNSYKERKKDETIIILILGVFVKSAGHSALVFWTPSSYAHTP